MSMFYELMMRKKTQIMYATIKGSLTENDGVFSGFSGTNYLAIQEPFKINADTVAEFVFKINISSIASGYSFFGTLNSYGLLISMSNAGRLSLYIGDGSSWNIASGILATSVLSTDIDYFVKLIFNKQSVSLLISTDGIAYTGATTTITLNQEYVYDLCYGIGRTTGTYFRGSIDLNRSYIKLGSTKYNLQAVVGYTIVGSPSIVDGVVSGFSASDYLQLPTISSTRYDKIQLHTKIRTESSVVGCCLFTVSNAYYQGIYISNSTKKIGGYVQFGAGKTLVSNVVAETNTDYIIDFIIDITNKKLTLTVNGDTVEAENIATSTLRSLTYLLGYGYDGAFNGSMFLSETYIKINNKLWFNGQQA